MTTTCEDIDRKTGFKSLFYTNNVFLFVPNIIDYIRVAFLVGFVYNASLDNYVAASICYVVSVSLDELDGNSARYFGQTSLFGMILDILIDEATVLCICTILSTLYPKYIIIFQLYTVLDIAGQWTNYQYAAMYNNNKFARTDDWLLNIYFNRKVFTNLWVYGNHVFLLMLYLSFYTSVPELPVFWSTVCVWKVLAVISGPWSISRLLIMVYLLVDSLSKIADHDARIRLKNLQDENDTEIKNKMAKDDKHSYSTEKCAHLEFGKTLERKVADCSSVDNEEFINRVVSGNNIVIRDDGTFCTDCRNELLSQLFLTRKTCMKNRCIEPRHIGIGPDYCCNLRQRHTCYSSKYTT